MDPSASKFWCRDGTAICFPSKSDFIGLEKSQLQLRNRRRMCNNCRGLRMAKEKNK